MGEKHFVFYEGGLLWHPQTTCIIYLFIYLFIKANNVAHEPNGSQINSFLRKKALLAYVILSEYLAFKTNSRFPS